MAEQILLNRKQISELFGMSERHIARLYKSGRFLQPIRLGKTVRWSRAAIEEWVAHGCKVQ